MRSSVDVARGLLAEREVLPDHHLDDVQVFDEQFVDVALRGELHEVGGERHHQEDVDAQFLDELGAPGQRGQLRRMAAGEHDLHRMRVERHQHRRHAAGPAGLDGVIDQLGMSAMHTVEHADGHDTSAPVRGDLVRPPPALHSRKPTARRVAVAALSITRSGDDCLNFVIVSPDGNPRDLSTVAQDYLKVIWTAQEWSLEKVSTKMLAERIGVSASTASESIRKLADQGLVDHEKYGAVTLTEAGRDAALAMVRRHRLMETFLVRELGYSWDEVHDEAEVLEHAVSDRMLDRIDAKLGYPDARPARRPDPRRRWPGAHPGRPAAVGLRGRRRGTLRPDLRRGPGDAAVLRQRGHQPGLPAAGARPSRLRGHDLGGRRESGRARRRQCTTVDLGSPAAQAIWVVAS